MSTLRPYQCNPSDVIQNAKMIYAASERYTFVVEGDADLRFFKQWMVDDTARLVNVRGKEKVKAVWKLAKERRFLPIYCLANLDFDFVINNRQIVDSQFVYISMQEGGVSSNVECNDLDAALIRSHAFLKVMMRKIGNKDLNGDHLEMRVGDLREKLRVAARNLGAFRAADQNCILKTGRSPIGGDFAISDLFFNAETVFIDTEKVKQVLRRSSRQGNSAMEDLIEIAEKLLRDFDSGWHLCRGHDLTCMLANHLTKVAGRNVAPGDIERDLSEAFELEMVWQTRFGMKLKQIGETAKKSFLRATH